MQYWPPKWSQNGVHFGVQFWTPENGISLRIYTINEEFGGPKSDPFCVPFGAPKWGHFDVHMRKMHENKWFLHYYYVYNIGSQNGLKNVPDLGPSFGPPEMVFP